MKVFVELAKKNAEDLEKELASAQLEIVKLTAQLSTGAASKEAGLLRNTKRKIARIRTLQQQRRDQ